MNRRKPLTVFALLFVLRVVLSAPAQEAATLHVGFGPSSFVGVNEADAKAAFQVFTRTVAGKRGYDLNVIVHTFRDSVSFAAAVTNRSLHLVIMTAWTSLEYDLDKYLEPCFLATDHGLGPREYLLLVRADSETKSAADLSGKRGLLLENTNCEMSLQWFETLCL